MDTVYKSTNAGASWSEASADLQNAAVNAVCISPADPNVLIAGTRNDGIYKSINGGLNWTQKLANVWNYKVNDVQSNPGDPNEYLAATEWGLLYSGDAGETWQQFSDQLDNVPVNDIALVPGASGTDILAATSLAGIWTTLGTAAPAAVKDWQLY
jgi:photosystem II stability/assembly factor-like uncharacterized protein